MLSIMTAANLHLKLSLQETDSDKENRPVDAQMAKFTIQTEPNGIIMLMLTLVFVDAQRVLTHTMEIVSHAQSQEPGINNPDNASVVLEELSTWTQTHVDAQ